MTEKKREIERLGYPYAFRYRPFNDYTIDEIEKGYMFFSATENLNDPFDGSSDLMKLSQDSEEWEELYEIVSANMPNELERSYLAKNFTPESLAKMADENMLKFVAQQGIACFSINHYSMLLWGNYATNHKGVCLQYNVKNDTDFFTGMRNIVYEEHLKEVEYHPFRDKPHIMDAFFKKQKQWENEYEIRLVKSPSGKHSFKREALRNVIIGYNAEKQFVEKIVEAVKSNYTDTGVYQMQKPTKFGSVTFTPL